MLYVDPELVLPLLEPLDELEELEEPELLLEELVLDELDDDELELLLDEELAAVEVLVEVEVELLLTWEPELLPERLLLVEPDDPFPEDDPEATQVLPVHARPPLQG